MPPCNPCLQYCIRQGSAQHTDKRPAAPRLRTPRVGRYPPHCRMYRQYHPQPHVGVLATSGTIKSESYPLEIRKLFPDIKVSGEACPLWVSLVENNEALGDGTDYFIRKYINELLAKDREIDTAILGCTHYPILLPKIQQYMPAGITIVSQGQLVADSLKDYLHRHPEIDIKCTRGGKCTYYTTEAEEKFIESASIFLNEAITVRRIEL